PASMPAPGIVCGSRARRTQSGFFIQRITAISRCCGKSSTGALRHACAELVGNSLPTMLRRLTIRDFVIVDRLELEFRAGFGTLTGETGAGKSILVDALGLALGDRSDATTVRAGRDKADIVAEFDLPPDGALAAWLDAADLAGEDVVMLRRVVDAGGRSRSWINGVPVTLAQLREAGEWLADIHGQHGHLALLRADAQRALLDAQAGAGALVAQVERAHREWQRIARLRLQAEHDASASE